MTNPRTAGRSSLLLLAGVLLVAAIVQGSLWGRVVQDDTYISLVYARNLAAGDGLVYNAGEEAVEGYSNFLWTVLTAGAMKIGLDPIVFVQLAGLLSALGVLVLTVRLTQRLGSSPAFALVAGLLLAANLTFATESVGGLETPLFSLLVLAAVLPRCGSETAAGQWLSSLACGFAALTRPEGILLFALIESGVAVQAALQGQHDGARLLGLWRRLLPFGLVVGAHLLFRWFTYGDWVPNTFHAKVSAGPEQWLRGFRYVTSGLLFLGPFLFFLPYVLAWWRRSETGFSLCLWVSTWFSLYVIFVGGDFKPTFRFLMPVLPLWYVLAADSLRHVSERTAATLGRRGTVAVLVLFGILGAVSTWRLALHAGDWIALEEKALERERVGRFLNGHLPKSAWLAVSNAGAIPYFAQRRAVDMFGLSDKHIAQREVQENAEDLAGHEKGDGAYVLARGPDVILFLRLDYSPVPLAENPNWKKIVRQMAFGTSEKEIAASAEFYQAYEVQSHPLPDGGYVNYFRRRSPG